MKHDWTSPIAAQEAPNVGPWPSVVAFAFMPISLLTFIGIGVAFLGATMGRFGDVGPSLAAALETLIDAQGWTLLTLSGALLVAPFAILAVIRSGHDDDKPLQEQHVIDVCQLTILIGGAIAFTTAGAGFVALVASPTSSGNVMVLAELLLQRTLVLFAAIGLGAAAIGCSNIVHGWTRTASQKAARRLAVRETTRQRALDQIESTRPLLARTRRGIKRRALARSTMIAVPVTGAVTAAVLAGQDGTVTGLTILAPIMGLAQVASNAAAAGFAYQVRFQGPRRTVVGDPPAPRMHRRTHGFVQMLTVLMGAMALLTYPLMIGSTLDGGLRWIGSLVLLVGGALEWWRTPWSWIAVVARGVNRSARRTLGRVQREELEERSQHCRRWILSKLLRH